MEIFGIGVPEMFIIGLIALVFIGPDKLPEAARTVGGWVREIRGLTNEATSVWREAMEVPETIKSTITSGTNGLGANRGNPTPVPYVPPAFSNPQSVIAKPEGETTTFVPATTPSTNGGGLEYPAPFDPVAPPVVNPHDDRLDYPAPFQKN